MHVIQNLEVKDIAQVARVSKKINEVTNQESLWKNVLLRQLSKFFFGHLDREYKSAAHWTKIVHQIQQ